MDLEIRDELRAGFRNAEYRTAYVKSFVSTSIAAQIKVLRVERGWSQCELAGRAEMKQSAISRLENVNYEGWSVSSLVRIAQAFDLALVVRFESFGTVLDHIAGFNRTALKRPSFHEDPVFQTKDIPSLSQTSVPIPRGKGTLAWRPKGERTPDVRIGSPKLVDASRPSATPDAAMQETYRFAMEGA